MKIKDWEFVKLFDKLFYMHTNNSKIFSFLGDSIRKMAGSLQIRSQRQDIGGFRLRRRSEIHHGFLIYATSRKPTCYQSCHLRHQCRRLRSSQISTQNEIEGKHNYFDLLFYQQLKFIWKPKNSFNAIFHTVRNLIKA